MQEHLPGESVAAAALWVTVPHHFAIWLRVYASPADFNRWRERFVIGPFLMVLMAYVAIRYAPLTLVLIVSLWDHQYSLMQHGFARIYDFKARAGAEITAGFDLLLNWILFVNMLIVSPLFPVPHLRTPRIRRRRQGKPAALRTIAAAAVGGAARALPRGGRAESHGARPSPTSCVECASGHT